MRVRTVADLAAPASLTTSVWTWTVPDSFDTCGVVTNVPYQATCRGAVITRRTLRYRPPEKVCSPARGARRGSQKLLTRTATRLSPGWTKIGDVKGESGIAAPVLAHTLPVDKQFRDLEGAIELQVDSLAYPCGGNCQGLTVPAVADVELRRGKIGQREGVRQANLLPRAVVKANRLRTRGIAQLKAPLAVEVEALALAARASPRAHHLRALRQPIAERGRGHHGSHGPPQELLPVHVGRISMGSYFRNLHHWKSKSGVPDVPRKTKNTSWMPFAPDTGACWTFHCSDPPVL